MGFSWPFRRHSRWQKQLDAYVDGELRADAVAAFEGHLKACDRCEPEVVARRELKRMAATLPQLPVPRSFRITPGMLVEAPVPAGSRGRAVVMRLAQVTAGLATVAFGGVLAAHVWQGDESSQDQRASAENDVAPLAGDDDSGPPATDAFGTPEFPLESEGSQGSGTPLPEVETSPVGAAGRGETETPGLTRDLAEPQVTTDSGYVAPESNEGETGQPVDVGTTSSVGPEEAGENGGLSGFVAAEIALAGVACVAATTWLVTRRRGS